MNLVSISEIEQHIAPSGLIVRGTFCPKRQDLAQDLAMVNNSASIKSVVLVGSVGSAFWPVFEQSAEFSDNKDHPLDRWSRRLGNTAARRFQASAIYPFDGPPYFPFLRWSALCEPVESSPLGMLIHQTYGLWHAFRFALLLPEVAVAGETHEQGASPCELCSLKPCLSGCPVAAFAPDGYDVGTCADYLHTNPSAKCHRVGCLARNSCPVAPQNRYEKAHAQFHMAAFVQAREAHESMLKDHGQSK